MTTQHGGSRPATRADDGRHNNGGHASAGRKPQKATLQLGNVHYAHVRSKEGKQSGPSLLLEVTMIDRHCIELTDQHTGEIVHIVR